MGHENARISVAARHEIGEPPAAAYIFGMQFENLPLKESSSIAAAAYDRNRRILRVGYRAGKAAHRGGTYDYFDVPPPVVRQFLGAESLGRFVNGQIKPHYKYKKVN